MLHPSAMVHPSSFVAVEDASSTSLLRIASFVLLWGVVACAMLALAALADQARNEGTR